jgi:ABC-type multidrug transport system ATPase subunit
MKRKIKGSRAVDGVSFGVKAGEIFALLGVTGSGKTSVFNMILGEENLSGGSCILNGGLV